VNPTETVAAAADKLERILAGATPGPWRRGGYGNYGPTVSAYLPGPPYDDDEFGVETHDSERGRVDAEYLETMNPIVGRAVLAVLHAAALNPSREEVALAQAILDQHQYEGSAS
jgi:hypothetical protein